MSVCVLSAGVFQRVSHEGGLRRARSVDLPTQPGVRRHVLISLHAEPRPATARPCPLRDVRTRRTTRTDQTLGLERL